MLAVSATDAAYAAGFFDGEGCISISHQKTTVSRGKRYACERFSLAVSMSQNDPAPLRWLAARFGGSVRFLRGKRSYDQGHYERWNWMAPTKAALQFLRVVRPFLIVKATQADLAFAFDATIGRQCGLGRGVRLRPEIQEARRAMYLKMKELKYAFDKSGSGASDGGMQSRGNIRQMPAEECGR